MRDRGVPAALGAALLFGASTPAAKVLLADVGPWLLAGLLYLGAGSGLFVWRRARRAPAVHLPRADAPWLAAAVLAGGIVAPVLLMCGLAGMPASGASLLLNAESVFTALLAWVVFRENVDPRVATGMGLIALGAVVLAWPGQAQFAGIWPAAAILGACLLWGFDNNLTRRVALTDATWLAMIKGLVAGIVNLGGAMATTGVHLPGPATVIAAMCVGFASYGASLTLFVVALRSLGTARTGAYFGVAPFVGALLAVVALSEPLTVNVLLAGGLMAGGVWLHLTETHLHAHTHTAQDHAHPHDHTDPHHAHTHEAQAGAGHPLAHHHDGITHTHTHYPDAHHRHSH